MKNKSNYLYISIVVTLITLLIGTILHDPILHSVVAFLLDWDIETYNASIAIGSTSALPSNVSTFSYWIFFMFPSLFIFLSSLLITLKYPNKLIGTIIIILLMLNFSSLLPNVIGSDSYSAVQVLILSGFSSFFAYLIHWAILLLNIIIIGIILNILIENNFSDAKNRGKL